MLTCLGLDGFAVRLTFWIITPIILVGLVLVAMLGLLLWEQVRARTDARAGLSLAKSLVRMASFDRSRTFGKRLLQVSLPAVVRMLFLVYPLATNVSVRELNPFEVLLRLTLV